MATDIEMAHNPTLEDVEHWCEDYRPVGGIVSLDLALTMVGTMFSRGASIVDCEKVATDICNEFLTRRGA